MVIVVLLPPPDMSLDEIALFLDLDGTLAPIELNPAMVVLPAGTTAILAKLAERMSGALAIVSGRSDSELDRLLHPLKLPFAACHGTIVRDASGAIASRALAREGVVRMTKAAHKALGKHEGIVIEAKDGGVAIHYRSCPQNGPLCRSVAQHISGVIPNTYCQSGKMVVEIVPNGVSKGNAIKHLLATSPFLGRIPVFAGDDLTDETGFSAVNDSSGISIKVGTGSTSARWRLAGTEAVTIWLSGLLTRTASR